MIGSKCELNTVINSNVNESNKCIEQPVVTAKKPPQFEYLTYFHVIHLFLQ